MHKYATSLIFLFSLITQSLQALEIEPASFTKLENGNIIFKNIQDRVTPGVEAIFKMRTSRIKLWQTITDYQNYTKNFDNVERLRVINETKEGAVIEFWMKSKLKTFHYTVYRKYENPFHKLEWNQISGDFLTNKGSWEIFDTEDGNFCIVKYQSFVELDGFWGKTFNKFFVPEATRRIQIMVGRLRKILEVNSQI